MLTCTSESWEYSEKVSDVCNIIGGDADKCFDAIVEVLTKRAPNKNHLFVRVVFDTALNSCWKKWCHGGIKRIQQSKILHLFEHICSDVMQLL